MSFVHRGLVDGRVFRRAVRSLGGTVLIDTSGSMSLSAENVDAILVAARSAVKIAMYSGKGDVGELRVIASKGRRAAVDDLAPFGSGNIVDLPALEWLARERGPRVWISDGGVTGIDDVPSGELQRRCTSLCARSKVERVRDVATAVEVLEKRR